MSCVLSEAQSLYDLDMNVMPIPFAEKTPYGRWSVLHSTRLHRDDLPDLMDGSNLAVIAGKLSANLTILDCDSTGRFTEVGRRMEDLGIRTWVRNGSRGGQYWFRSAGGEIANAKPFADLDVLGQRKYSVAPPSIHPTGMAYEWISRPESLPPLVDVALLSSLDLHLEHADRNSAELRQTLPALAYRILVHGDDSAYKSNSEAMCAATLSLIVAGFSDAYILGLFQKWQPPHYRKKGRGAEAWVQQYLLPDCHQYLRRNQSTTRDSAGSFIRFADSRAWPGRTGNSDRSVYLALCKRMALEHRRTFRASLREISEIASLSINTVRASLIRLEQEGLVISHGSNNTSGASLFEIRIPESFVESDTVGVLHLRRSMYCINSAQDWSLMDHDAWHVQGLGKTAYYCWRALTGCGPLTVTQLVEATGRTGPTVKRNLALLAEHGLAQTYGLVWKAEAIGKEHLDVVAQAVNTTGKQEARRLLHTEQRQRWAARIIRRSKEFWQRSHL